MISLINDRKQNTINLLSVPNLKNKVALSVGNAIFIPSETTNNDYKTICVDIDNSPCIIVSTDSPEPKSVNQIIPAEYFDFEGISYLFKESGIPIEFKKCIVKLSVHNQDKNLLSIAFNDKELPDIEKVFNEKLLENNHNKKVVIF